MLKKYDYFGERALLNDAPRAATVTAVTSLKLLYISKVRASLSASHPALVPHSRCCPFLGVSIERHTVALRGGARPA